MASKTATKRTSQRARGKQSRKRSQNTRNNSNDKAFYYILLLFGSFALSLLLMIAVLGFGGTFGIASRYVLFGLFGVFAYLFPVALAGGTYYSISNRENKAFSTKVIAACITYLLTTVLLELFLHGEKPLGGFDGFATSQQLHTGGGMIGGFLSGLFVRMFGVVGAYVISFAGLAICLVFLTDKMPINRLQEDSDIRRRKRELRQKERESEREYMRAQRRIREEEAYRAQEANFLREEKRRESELRYYERKQQELRKQQLSNMGADVAGRSGIEDQQSETRGRIPYESSRGKGISLNTTILPTSNAHGSDEVNEIILPDDDPLPEAETAAKIEAAPIAAPEPETKEAPQMVISEPEPVPVTELPFRDPDEPLGSYFAEPVPISDMTDGLEEAASFVMHESKPDAFESNIASTSESDDMKPVEISDFEEIDDQTWEFATEEPPLADDTPVESTLYEAEVTEAAVNETVVAETDPVDFIESVESATSDTEIPEMTVEAVETEQSSTADDRSEYIFPTPDLLTKQKNRHNADRSSVLQETADKLQQTLENFGVKVTITDACCGPTVTRYELQPQKGVKVSKIVNLADDIKLNLAAEDIRIEAPIPGKAAVGIEVPNKEAAVVSFRELMESNEFQQTASPIAFAAGRDIAGNIMISDIAKMPHVLIAGATGSGKSVCINTIIMSILFKAHPDDVKFIMIDPKVVELSVYNGIPHLLIPVVTDPKKASGALRWAVKEMMDRYESFAKTGVRDMKGYNARIRDGQISYDMNGETVTVAAKKLPQIVVIVDELADLMMVASNEVEEAICRLAQLARAAGIHLVIATQRPSVNVITGLIKANMPSRIAFAVTSGIDSRTILDMTGAEKLLGKGDMLYYPQGFTKPLRVQGAFVMDEDVAKVVDFIRANSGKVSYDPTIEDTIKESPSTDQSVAISTTERSDDKDQYFEEAARLLIDKEKGSIGMLQRYFKVGFNRAARIMDQLEEAGVVGPEEGTKPRKVLMTLEQFEGEGEAHEE